MRTMAKKQLSKPPQVKNDAKHSTDNRLYLGGIIAAVFACTFLSHYDTAASLSSQSLLPTPMSQCRYVMAESNLPGAGWGIFSLEYLQRSDKVLYPDLTIAVLDTLVSQNEGIQHLYNNYSWHTESTFQRDEGKIVQMVAPGVSMLANAAVSKDGYLSVAAVPNIPRPPDPGTLQRGQPNAGSSTYYHGRQFHAYREIEAGEEILIGYGSMWKDRLESILETLPADLLAPEKRPTVRKVDELRREGLCIDHIRPELSAHGLGAIATRDLPTGTVILPLPVLGINRTSLDVMPSRTPQLKQSAQLLLNYCFAHPLSSLLLYPYSPTSNYLNHGGASANARVQWSTLSRNLDEAFELSAEDIIGRRQWGMMLEVVAVRHIAKGEEVTMDYGREFDVAWQSHLDNFHVEDHGNLLDYTYSVAMNEANESIRTEEEQREHPYASNLVVAAYYVYSQGLANPSNWHADTSSVLPVDLWPCRILRRYSDDTYRIEFLGDEVYDRAPPMGFVVDGVPRKALRFRERRYRSDQNLPNAFRHPMGFEDYPPRWLDLRQ